jgi:hypothetical protein
MSSPRYPAVNSSRNSTSSASPRPQPARKRPRLSPPYRAEYSAENASPDGSNNSSNSRQPSPSSSGTGSSIGPYYGIDDDSALDNLFAVAYPQTFTTLSRPHGDKGLDVPSWALRPSAVWLWGRKPFRISKVRDPIPDRDPLERKADRREAEKNETSITVGPRIGFQLALEYHRSRQTTTIITTIRIRDNSGIKWKQITEISFTTSRESFRISLNPLFNALFSESNEDEEWNGFFDPGSSSSNNTTEIPNPLISGELAPTIEAL